MPNNPTKCPVCHDSEHPCGSRRCAFALALDDRLVAVEARLPHAGNHYCDKPTSCPGGGTINPAPPPSAEPTFEQLVEKVGPVSSGQLAGSAEPTTAPVASGASVPDGFVLGEGWRLAERDWACTPYRGSCLSAGAAYETTTTEGGPMCGVGACATHAVEMGALVPVEPPKAETAQEAEPRHSEDCDIRAGRSRNCSCGGRDVPAEPSAPVGFRVTGRSEPGVDGKHAGPVQLARSIDGEPYPVPPRFLSENTPVDYRLWDAGCYDILEPIAEPAAPPVAAKLSERGCNFCGVVVRCDCCAGPLGEGDSDTCGDCRGVMSPAQCKLADLETALEAAQKAYRALEMELDTAKRDRGRLREQLNVARREADAAKAENEALRKQLETRDVRIAGLEASHREDVERAVREERERLTSAVRAWARNASDRRSAFELATWMTDSGDPVPKVGG